MISSNPLGLGEIRPGQAVLDLGSRAGLDCLLAAWRVGPTGKVIGADLCPEMVKKARRNASLLGLHNAEFVQAGIEKLPLSDASVDVVLSNGVFNLCPDKPAVLAEAFRVLRPGGRLQMADILQKNYDGPSRRAWPWASPSWPAGWSACWRPGAGGCPRPHTFRCDRQSAARGEGR